MYVCIYSLLHVAAESVDGNPQTLLFSATLPHWVHETAKKYLRPDRRHFDLVCDDTVKTSKTVRVGTALLHCIICQTFYIC